MELGLIYMNARYYVPSLGRFASADTLVPDPTNPQQFNRYAYVLNNPLRFTDPTGHVCYDPVLDTAVL
jgi:RHS repeat-associated protein